MILNTGSQQRELATACVMNRSVSQLANKVHVNVFRTA